MTDHSHAAWLIERAPILERIKAEDEAIAKLHSSHVDAWLDAPSCEICGETKPIVTRDYRHPQCQDCHDGLAETYREPREQESFGEMTGRLHRGPL